MALLDSELRFQRINARLAVLNGASIEDHLGRTIAEVIPDTAAVVAPLLREVLRTGRPIIKRELYSSTRAHDGQKRWYRASYYPISTDGHIKLVSALVEDITAEKAAGSALAESELRYRTLFETTREGILIVNDSGRYVDVNPSFCRILKTGRERLIGAHFSEFIQPERLAEAEAGFGSLQNGGTTPVDFPLVAADGTIVELSWTSSSSYLPGLYFCVCRDITEQRRVEKESSRLLASIPELISRIGPDLRFRYISPAVTQFTGMPPEFFIGKNHREAGIPEHLAALLDQHLRRVFDTARAHTLEFDFESPVAGLRHLFGTAIPDLGPNGSVDSVLGIVRDMTEQKRAERDRDILLGREQEARETAEQLNRVGPVLAAQLDSGKLVQSVTDIATRLTGAEFGAFFHNVVNQRGESYMLYTLSGVDREKFSRFPMPRNTDVFAPTFRGEGVVRSDDITKDPRYGRNAPRSGMPEGHLPVRSYLAVPVISRSGEVLGGLFFGHSAPGRFAERHEAVVTGIAAQAAIAMDNARLFAQSQWTQNQLENSNEELRRANRDLETFAYSASHDIQEPLRNVSIYTQLLQSKLGPEADPATEKLLEGILAGTTRMQHLVEDLLSYSQATKLAEGPVPATDAAEVFDAVIQELRRRIDESGAKITRGPLPKVRVHQVHLAQLLQNLLGNALKYRSQEPPRVHMSAQLGDGSWMFSIVDNGIGIEPRYRAQIFGLFKRLHNRDEYSGSGVGLAICQRIVEQYGGRIWVQDSESGTGSDFRFTLPDRPLDKK